MRQTHDARSKKMHLDCSEGSLPKTRFIVFGEVLGQLCNDLVLLSLY